MSDRILNIIEAVSDRRWADLDALFDADIDELTSDRLLQYVRRSADVIRSRS